MMPWCDDGTRKPDKYIDELMKKSKESEVMNPKIEGLSRTNQELDVKIWKMQERSEELERNTNELEVSLI